MYENLIETLRGNDGDGLYCEAADAIEELSHRAAEWEVIAESWQKACKG